MALHSGQLLVISASSLHLEEFRILEYPDLNWDSFDLILLLTVFSILLISGGAVPGTLLGSYLPKVSITALLWRISRPCLWHIK